MKHRYKCICLHRSGEPCSAFFETEDDIRPQVEADKLGWALVMDVSNGLTLEYVCPLHVPLMQAALDQLYALFGSKTRYINFGRFYSKKEKG